MQSPAGAGAAPAECLVPAADRLHPEPSPYIHPGGECARWACVARVAGAEALGTALLVLLASEPAPPLYAGLAVAMLVQCFGGVSGAQLNPCVTLGAWWCGRMRGARALAELAAQLAGAALGAAAHAALAPRPAPLAGLTLPAPHYPLYKAVCVEALCAACVVLCNMAQWRAAEGAHSWPLRIGAVVAALAALAGPATGAGMNPARSFGPALWHAHWDHHWVYWAGPLAGAAAACGLQRAWRPPAPPRAPRTAPAPRRT